VIVWLVRARVLALVSAGLFALSLGVKLYLWKAGVPVWFAFPNPVVHLDALAAGGIVATFLHLGYARRIARFSPVVFCAAAIGLLAIYRYEHGLRWDVFRSTLTPSVGTVLFALLSGSIIAMVATGAHLLESILETSPLRWVGKYSYAIYVFHIPIWLVLFEPHSEFWHRSFPHAALGLILISACSFAAAFGSWNLLEKHFLKLKDHFAVEASK
jgi:peptidoglycan/LPS O-acetylase OafA/YrhL